MSEYEKKAALIFNSDFQTMMAWYRNGKHTSAQVLNFCRMYYLYSLSKSDTEEYKSIEKEIPWEMMLVFKNQMTYALDKNNRKYKTLMESRKRGRPKLKYRQHAIEMLKSEDVPARKNEVDKLVSWFKWADEHEDVNLTKEDVYRITEQAIGYILNKDFCKIIDINMQNGSTLKIDYDVETDFEEKDLSELVKEESKEIKRKIHQKNDTLDTVVLNEPQFDLDRDLDYDDENLECEDGELEPPKPLKRQNYIEVEIEDESFDLEESLE